MSMLGRASAPAAPAHVGETVVDDAISNVLDPAAVWRDLSRDHWWVDAPSVEAAARALPAAVRRAVPTGWSVKERVVLCAAALPAPESASQHSKVTALHRAVCYAISREDCASGRAALEARLTALAPDVALAQREAEMARVDAAVRSSAPLGTVIPAGAARPLRKVLVAQTEAEQGRALVEQVHSMSGKEEPATLLTSALATALPDSAGVDIHAPTDAAPFVEITGVPRDRVAFTSSAPRAREQPTAYADFIREAARRALGRDTTVVFDTVRHGVMTDQLSLLSVL